MKKSRVLFILATVVAIAILLVACGGGKTTNPVAETQSVSPVTTQETGGETAATATPPSGVPDDVPIMPNARELQASNLLNVIYKIDVSINDVVAFYQQELPNYGWETVNNPDSVVGSMAQMARAKANGDRITFSIQYNPVGEFCIVQIYLTRVP
jgi:hypothetical protein